jgi:hypothetical protein
MPLGELPGRIGNTVKRTFGFEPSGLPPEDELYGINPRRAYWSAALADLANFSMGEKFQNAGQATNAAQQQWVAQNEQNRINNQYKDMIGQAQLISAMKPGRGQQPTAIIQEAQYLFPDDPAAQQKYIEDYRAKSGININWNDKNQGQYTGKLLEQVPAIRDAAMQASDEIARYNTMEQLIPQLGNTGTAKEWLTSLRGGLASLGMGGAAGFLDALSEAAGADFFSGDQGAAELYRALANQDVLDRAKDLYPVSNTDIEFLKQISATMKAMSDPDAMRSMIGNQRARSQRQIDQYNWYRQTLSGFEGIPPLPEIIPYDINAIQRRTQELERELGIQR